MKNKVLVAMGIGIFAALTFNAATVTTLAEGEPDPVQPNNNEQKDNTLADEAVKAAETASTVLNEAAETVIGEDGTNAAEDNLEEKADEVLGLDPNANNEEHTKEEKVTLETSPKADALSGELTDGDWVNDYENAYDGNVESDKNKTPVSGANDLQTTLDDISAKGTGLLDQMENQDTLAAGKANEIANVAEAANGKVDDADKLVKEAETLLPDDLVSNATNVVNQAAQTIANAETQEEADNAMAVANQAVTDVNNQISNANNRIADIETELANLKSDHKALVDEYNGKVKELEALEKKFYELKDVAEADAAALEAERARLEKEAKDLYDASVAAEAAYDERRYKELQDQENYLKTSLNGLNKQQKLEAYRTFVYYVMKNYYVPDVLGGEMLGDRDAFINDEEFVNDKSKWQAPDGKYTYMDAAGKTYTSTEGDVLRYGTINYKLKGSDEVHQMRVNYKTSNANNLFNNVDFPGLVIFEKTEHHVIRLENGVEMDITDELINSVNENGYYIDKDGNIIGKDENGNIIRYGAGKTDDNTSELPKDEVEDADNLVLSLGESKNDVVLGNEQVSYEIINGKLTKTVKASMSVTTYKGVAGEPDTENKTIDGHAANLATSDASKNAFVAAVQEKINALEDGQSIKIGSGDDAVTYTKGSTADETGYEEITNTANNSWTVTYKTNLTKVYEETSNNGYKNKPTALNEGEKAIKNDETIKAKIAELESQYGKKVDAEAVINPDFVNHNNSNDNKFGYKIIFKVYDLATKTYEAPNEKKAKKKAEADGISSDSITETSQTVSYGYNALNYILSIPTVLIDSSDVANSTVTLSTTVYDDVASTEKIVYRNDNWYKGNLILSEFDYNNSDNHYVTDGKEGNATKNIKIDKSLNDDFRNKVDGVGKIPAAYQNLIDKAEASQKAFADAADEVKALQEQIAALESKHEITKIRELEYDLANARAKLNVLTAQRDELVNRLNEVINIYNDRIADLNTPADVAGDGIVTVAPLALGDAPVVAAAPAGAVLGANRPVEAEGTVLGAVRSGSVLGERRGPQGAVLGKRRSPKTADGAMGGMVAGMMLSMMSAFGGAKVLKKKHENEE